ncbi:MMPL family transporter [Actinoplanes sp. CA-252034]|uniref:MMPL family transporter n=1 Tax=Actinoplanes sp. CA-252034 TaxID=3239906 RepID=UPI003D986C6D
MMLAALGRTGGRRRRLLLAVWLILITAGVVLGGRVFDRLTTGDDLRPDAESQLAERRAERLQPEGPMIVAVVGGRDVYDPALVADVTAVTTGIRALPGVAEVQDLYGAPGGRIGADNRSSLIRVELDRTLPDDHRERVEDAVAAALHRIDAPEVLVSGETLAERAFAEQAVADAAFGESVAIAVLAVLLVVILGGLVAGAIPLVAALATVSVTLLGLYALSAVTGIGQFTVNVVTLLGIGLSVDYALLVVARFREERDARPGTPVEELLARTTATAGRTVLVSGLAVATTMAGLSVFGEPMLSAMAFGGTVAVLVATTAGLTVVPPLIAVAHRRIPTARARNRPGLLARLTRIAQDRPGPVALAVTAGLLVMSLPFLLGVDLQNSDARALPATSEARRLHETVQRDFSGGQADPVVVVVDADPADAAVRDFLNTLNTLDGVLRVAPRPDVTAPAAIVDVTPSSSGHEVVRAVRALDPPFPVLVGGAAAELVDRRDSVAARFPIALLVVVLSTVVLLFWLTGSLVIPVKALLMNALTLLAALGALVVVFQWGAGDALLGFQSWGAIDVTTPVLLFVFLFGLSMDYQVFLLARITEDRDVHAGVVKSGPVVTAAALCIGVVFAGFLLGDLIAVKEIGFAMAVALLLDVTVIRGLLLPALMTLLGDWNWWAPAPLRRLRRS